MNTLTPEENSVLAMMLFDSSENRNIFIIIIIENIKEFKMKSISLNSYVVMHRVYSFIRMKLVSLTRAAKMGIASFLCLIPIKYKLIRVRKDSERYRR